MLSILSYEGNVNQNYVPSHLSHNGFHKEEKKKTTNGSKDWEVVTLMYHWYKCKLLQP
jgi:hypothetical protein